MTSFTNSYQRISSQLETIQMGYQAQSLSIEETIRCLKGLMDELEQVKTGYNQAYQANILDAESRALEQKFNDLYHGIIGFSNRIQKPYQVVGNRNQMEPQDLNFRQEVDLQEKFLLDQGYKRILYVRGGGDCFYRAVYLYTVNEGMKNRSVLESLKGKIVALLEKENDEQLLKDILGVLETLNLIDKEPPSRFLELCATNQTFDQAMVRIFRKITINRLLENKTEFISEYCSRVNKMGNYAEQPEYLALAEALGLSIHMAMKEPKFALETYGTGPTHVDIYLHGEHFDILVR